MDINDLMNVSVKKTENQREVSFVLETPSCIEYNFISSLVNANKL